MAELRRLLLDQSRIRRIDHYEKFLSLNIQERHYLRRVLRLTYGSKVEITDGRGSLWIGSIYDDDKLLMSSTYDQPLIKMKRKKPLLGIAVVIPKRGFDDALRMSCELGIDKVQPLISERRVPQAEDRFSRWESILKDSLQQSERLYLPELLPTYNYFDFLGSKSFQTAFAMGIARENDCKKLNEWIYDLEEFVDEAWLLIGPEGGWTSVEKKHALVSGADFVSLGNTILRTSTAVVAASQIMVSSRDKFLFNS